MYEGSFAIGKNRLEFGVDRIMVDDETVMTEGVFRHAYTGEKLVRDGVATADEVAAQSWYLVEYRALVVWVMTSDSLILGEDTYKGEQARVVRPLGPGECPHLGPVGRA